MPLSFRMTDEGEIYDVNTVPSYRTYNRIYYHNRLKGEFECQHCTNIYSSISALRRHQVRSMKCNLLRANKELENLRNEQNET